MFQNTGYVSVNSIPISTTLQLSNSTFLDFCRIIVASAKENCSRFLTFLCRFVIIYTYRCYTPGSFRSSMSKEDKVAYTLYIVFVLVVIGIAYVSR